MNSSDSAEEIVKLYLDGVEHILKISGVGAKNLIAYLMAMSKSKEQTKGKTRLTNMLKTGKPLKIFTIKAKDLKKFSQEAKRYGILYCALANKKNEKIDGMVDIMVREEDASRINRIAERFNFEDVATIRKERELEKDNLQESSETPKSANEQFIDDIMPKAKEDREIPSNNTKETEEKNLSGISLNTKLNAKVEISSEIEKKSVIQELKEIEQEQKIKEQSENTVEFAESNPKVKDKNKEPKHLKDKNDKEKRQKGKKYKEPKHLDNTKSRKIKKSKNKGRSK